MNDSNLIIKYKSKEILTYSDEYIDENGITHVFDHSPVYHDVVREMMIDLNKYRWFEKKSQCEKIFDKKSQTFVAPTLIFFAKGYHPTHQFYFPEYRIISIELEN